MQGAALPLPLSPRNTPIQAPSKAKDSWYERLHNKDGSSVFIRDGLKVNTIYFYEEDNVELITVELAGVVHSMYKPRPKPF